MKIKFKISETDFFYIYKLNFFFKNNIFIILIFYNFFLNFNHQFELRNLNFDTFPISLLLKYFFRKLKFLNIFFSYLILYERSKDIFIK